MSPDSDPKSRLKVLYALINEHAHLYHALDEPAVSDAEYDLFEMTKLLLEISEEGPDSTIDIDTER